MITETHSTALGQSILCAVLLSTTQRKDAQIPTSTGRRYIHIQPLLDRKRALTANADPRELFQLFNTTFPFLLKYWFAAKPNHVGTTPREATLEDGRAVWGLAIHTQNSPHHQLTLHSCQVKLQRQLTLYGNTHPILFLDKYKIAHALCQFMFPQHKCYASNSPKYVRAGLHHRFGRLIYLFYSIKSPRDYPKAT